MCAAVVSEVASTPAPVVGSAPAPAQSQTSGSKSYGFYAGPAREVVAAVVSEVASVQVPVVTSAPAPAQVQASGSKNYGFYIITRETVHKVRGRSSNGLLQSISTSSSIDTLA